MSDNENFARFKGAGVALSAAALALAVGVGAGFLHGKSRGSDAADQVLQGQIRFSLLGQSALDREIAAVAKLTAVQDLQHRHQVETMQRLAAQAGVAARHEVAMAHLQMSLSKRTLHAGKSAIDPRGIPQRVISRTALPQTVVPQSGVNLRRRRSQRANQTLALLPSPTERSLTIQRKRFDPLKLDSVKAMRRTFAAANFDLASVRKGSGVVPRVFLAKLPQDVRSVPAGVRRKALFIKAMLPLILRANEEIRAERQRLSSIAAKLKAGASISDADDIFIAELRTAYNVKSEKIKTLLQHVDTVPPSLALAQAAEESGWGTSRFARHGNAIFGQRTYGGKNGLVPSKRRRGENFRVRSYGELYGSVRAYMHNLNSHRAYRELRRWRAMIRSKRNARQGAELAGTLGRYSERGSRYINTLKTIIRVNRLHQFDRAKLSPQPFRQAQDANRQPKLAALDRS